MDGSSPSFPRYGDEVLGLGLVTIAVGLAAIAEK